MSMLMTVLLLLTSFLVLLFAGFILAMMSVIHAMLGQLEDDAYRQAMQGIIRFGRPSPVVYVTLLGPILLALAILGLLVVNEAVTSAVFVLTLVGGALQTVTVIASRLLAEPLYRQVMAWESAEDMPLDWRTTVWERWFVINQIRFALPALAALSFLLALVAHAQGVGGFA